jgi:O-antigen/teichoic acid export membrane protein
MGSLTLARTWQQLVDYSHLGTRFSLDRFIPVIQDDERSKMVSSVIIFTFFSACIVFLTSVITTAGDATVIALTLCGVGISLANIIKCYYRASHRINDMLWLVLCCQLLPLLIPLAIYLIIHNWIIYLVSSILCYAIGIIHLLYKEWALISTAIKGNALFITLKGIASSSVWLFANSVFIFLYLVMDRFFIDYTYGRSTLGNYSIITFAFSALMVIPSTCSELLFVKIVKQSSESGKVVFIREISIISGVTITGIMLANVLMEYFITHFTSYKDLIPQMHIATVAVVPFAFTSIYYHVMNGLDLRKHMVCVSGLLTILLFIYYCLPLIIGLDYGLNYYLYGKLATGWFILIGYLSCIFFHKLKHLSAKQLK